VLFCSDGWKKRAVGKGVPSSTPTTVVEAAGVPRQGADGHGGREGPGGRGPARKLLAMHVTTAATERDWSEWGRMYTQIRNALSIKRAKKMVTINAQLGGMVDGNEGELYELEWIGEGGVGGGRERVKPSSSRCRGGSAHRGSTLGQHTGEGGCRLTASKHNELCVCGPSGRP
jgi:hypothetical protein